MPKKVYEKPKTIVIAAITKTGLMTNMSHTDQVSGTLFLDDEERVDFNWGGNGSENDKEKDGNGDVWGD